MEVVYHLFITPKTVFFTHFMLNELRKHSTSFFSLSKNIFLVFETINAYLLARNVFKTYNNPHVSVILLFMISVTYSQLQFGNIKWKFLEINNYFKQCAVLRSVMKYCVTLLLSAWNMNHCFVQHPTYPCYLHLPNVSHLSDPLW